MEKNYYDHIFEKKLMHADRDADKQAENTVLCFDVANLPKAVICPLFHKRKLNLYNMTGHLSLKNKDIALYGQNLWLGDQAMISQARILQ